MMASSGEDTADGDVHAQANVTAEFVGPDENSYTIYNDLEIDPLTYTTQTTDRPIQTLISKNETVPIHDTSACTLAPSTSTSIQSATSTQIPSTHTLILTQLSPLSDTSTPTPLTSTPIPYTSSPRPSTSTQIPFTSTPRPSTSMPRPSTPSPRPSTSSPRPSTLKRKRPMAMAATKSDIRAAQFLNVQSQQNRILETLAKTMLQAAQNAAEANILKREKIEHDSQATLQLSRAQREANTIQRQAAENVAKLYERLGELITVVKDGFDQKE